jgi:hypothetical protein
MSGITCDRSAAIFPIYADGCDLKDSVKDVFKRVSALCTSGGPEGPMKSDPLYRVSFSPGKAPGSAFHLPPDLRLLYPVAPLAYYLGVRVEADDRAYIEFPSGLRMPLPDATVFEAWAAEMLRRTFYLDCAVRCALVTGSCLNGLDLVDLLDCSAADIFAMDAAERFRIYSDPSLSIPGIPRWHMAAYLEPVPGSVETLPFLLRSLPAIYTARSAPSTEREIIRMSVRSFLGRECKPEIQGSPANGPIVLPSLYAAGTHLWFSEGYPMDAVKSSPRAFINRSLHGFRKEHGIHVGVICNDASMEYEADAIVEALSDNAASVDIRWDTGVSGFYDLFSRGFDLIQVIGHCDGRGFKCRDGFASVSHIKENRTPMFFFNSCASFREGAALIEKGSICGVATLFRVLDEAAVDICRNFYRMLGAGYPAYLALDAARECSVLGKEYILIGDGSFTCFEGGGLKPFYRLAIDGEECRLSCVMGNMDKGNIVASWSPEGKKMITDLGFETGYMPVGHLAAIADNFQGFCLYDRVIYDGVLEAAERASRDASGHRKDKRRRRRG